MESSEKIAALQMLQGMIARMSDNSLQMKKWSMTIIIGLIGAVITSREFSQSIIILFLPLLLISPFFLLDWMYLTQERKLTSAFEKISEMTEGNPLNIANFISNGNIKTRKTIWFFYIPITIIPTILIWIISNAQEIQDKTVCVKCVFLT